MTAVIALITHTPLYTPLAIAGFAVSAICMVGGLGYVFFSRFED